MTTFGPTFGDPGVNPFANDGSGGGNATVTRGADVTLTANTGQYQQQMAGAARSTDQVTASVGNLLTKVDNLFKLGGRTLKIVAAADVASMVAAAGAAGSLQASMSTLHATAAVNQTSFNAYGKSVDNVFSKFPQHQGNVVALINQITNLGVAGERDITKVATAVEKLGAATGESIPELTNDLIGLNRQMTGSATQNIAGYANAVLTVSKNAGTSVTPVLQFAQAIAPISRQAGIGEAAVIGISTAFSKAGADGTVAANAFNTIVSDITTLTKTGSPELTKYASFLGLTVDQFKKLPAASQVSGIFNAIAQGGPKSLNFLGQMGFGIRQLSAFQAVAQSGGLSQYIAQAQQASGNTNALDRGSKAADSGLDAAVTDAHNQITRFADMIGGPLLGPLTFLVHGFTDLMKGVNSVVHVLGPFATAVGVVAAPLAGIAGVALTHAPLIAGVAALRSLRGSGVGQAFREGRVTQSAIGGGMASEEAMAATTTGGVIAGGGTMPWRARGAFFAGRGVGAVFPGGAPSEEAAAAASGRSVLGRVLRAPFQGASWYIRSSNRPIEDIGKTGYERGAYAGTDLGAAAAGKRAAADTAGAKAAADKAAADQAGAKAGFALANGETAATKAAAMETEVATKTTTALGEVAAGATELAGTMVRTSSLIATAPMRAVGGSGKSLIAGLGIGMGAQYLGQSVGGHSGRTISDAGTGVMLGSMFGPEGMLIGGLAGAALGLFGHHKGAPDTSGQVDDALGPVKLYSQELGLATTNLASFTTAVDDATNAVNKNAPTNFATAAKITPADRQAAQTAKPDPTLMSLASASPKGTAAGVAYLQQLSLTTQGGMTPALLGDIKDKLIKAYGPDQAAVILNAYMKTGTVATPTPNFAALGSAAAGKPNADFKQIAGAAVTGISARALAAPGTQSQQAQLSAFQSLISSTGVTAGSQNANSLATEIAKAYGIDPKELTLGAGMSKGTKLTGTDLLIALANAGKGGSLVLSNAGLSTKGIQQALIQGSQVSGASGGAPGSALSNRIARTYVQQYLAQNPALATAFADPAKSSTSELAGQGPLGAMLSRSKLFTLASGTESGDPSTTQAAIEEAAAGALKLNKTTSAATAALQELADNSGGAAQTLLEGAAAWSRTLQAQKMPQMSQEQQGSVLAANLRASQGVIAADRRAGVTPSDTAVNTYKADQQAVADWQNSQQQRLLQMGQTLDEFHTQQERAEESYGLQVTRTVRNYNLQMLQADQDYTKQRARTLQDFNIQMARQAQSAAESIYNPFERVQSQSVVDGGMLVSNLQDQNERIQKQQAQVKQLRAEGLSQAAIDTLQLDNPANAQQTNAIATSVVNDPQTIAKINQLVAVRQKATTALTQSQYNEEFRNTIADFDKGLKRTADDYQTQKDRAALAQKTTLGDMATDFNIMVKQSGEDLTTQMTELYGSLADIFPSTLAKINKDIGNQFPQLAGMLTSEINQVFNDVLSGTGGSSSSGVGPIGSKNNPNATAGTLGVNPSGQVGRYGSNGSFTPFIGPVNKAGLPYIVSPTAMSANTPGGAQAYAQSRLKAYGWGSDQMAPLIKLWNNESGWSYTSYNSGSGAVGIPQLLPKDYRGHHNSGGHDIPAGYITDGKVQVDWGLNYIKSRYGSPAAASNFEFSHSPHWYAAGSIFNSPKVIGVGESGPEQVLPLNDRGAHFMIGFYDKVSTLLMQKMTVGRGIPGVAAPGQMGIGQYHEDHRTYYTGDINLSPANPADMERQLAQRARLRRLAQPAHAGN